MPVCAHGYFVLPTFGLTSAVWQSSSDLPQIFSPALAALFRRELAKSPTDEGWPSRTEPGKTRQIRRDAGSHERSFQGALARRWPETNQHRRVDDRHFC